MKISPNALMHPEDVAALESLKAVPLFSTAVKSFIKLFNERMIHGLSMAEKIRLSPRQLPELYRHLPPICETLGIEEPEFYLEMNPMPNAYTQGDTKVFITLTSGLVEYLDEDELQAVITHECGHILCHHVLYHTMTMMLLQYGSAVFGPVALMSEPLRLALLYWFRRSELSADRVAAVVMKNPKSMIETMVRLAGGPKSITEKIDLELYAQQANAYDQLLENQWDNLLQNLAIMNANHPFASVRTRELMRWSDTPEYAKVVETLHNPVQALTCPHCQAPVQSNWKFCGSCGQTLPPNHNSTEETQNG